MNDYDKQNRHRHDRNRQREPRRDAGGGRHKEEAETDGTEEPSPMQLIFKQFQLELDAKHDKYEKIVKLSRDITIDSKRAIFQLQRIPGSTPEVRDKTLKQVRHKLDEIINNKFYVIAEELVGQDAYQFLRAYSPGLQEYIEGESLYHYLKDTTLISHKDIQQLLNFSATKDPKGDATSDDKSLTTTESNIGPKAEEATEIVSQNVDKQEESPNHKCPKLETGDASVLSSATESQSVPSSSPVDCSVSSGSVTKSLRVTVPIVEYILGICDLTGEVMRLAITHVSTGDLDRPFELCNFLRDVYNIFTSFGFVNREFSKKVHVIQQSLVKVETACYNLHVRGSEVPKHMLVDMFSSHSENIAMDDDQ